MEGLLRNARAEALTRQLEQSELTDATDLAARAVVFELACESALDRPDVAHLHHVNEVDDDDAAEVAQADLTRDFRNGFEVRLVRDLFEVEAVGARAPRVDVDRDQRFGLIEDDRAAGRQLDAL